MSCIVAIHQPNFFPWMGYFDKIKRSDVFVLMDNVQYPEGSRGNWTNRVNILVNGEPKWITASVDRTYKGTKLIKDMRYSSQLDWREKIMRIIENNYRKTPNFSQLSPVVSKLIRNPDNQTVQYNKFAIKKLCKLMGIDTSKIVLGSELNVHGSSTELLIAMTKAVNGTAYLCGGGAVNYQDVALFEKNKIKLIYQEFRQTEYSQISNSGFIQGLSVLDYLFNIKERNE